VVRRKTKFIILSAILVIAGGAALAFLLLRSGEGSRLEQGSWQKGRILTARPNSHKYKSPSTESFLERKSSDNKRELEERHKEGKEQEWLVVIDPGHQEKADLNLEPIAPGASQKKVKVTSGASGVVTGVPEHQLVLHLSIELEKKLVESGVEVILTRRTPVVNISNKARAEMANQAKADLFVRIHANGSLNSSEKGISTLYPAKTKWTSSIYPLSRKAALLVQHELVKATQAENKGIEERKDITGFNWSKVPVILVEVGFLTNPEEDRRLNEVAYQVKIVEGLKRGILRYLTAH
jgi:N-acetylmuramoyl-L-alanine amidase